MAIDRVSLEMLRASVIPDDKTPYSPPNQRLLHEPSGLSRESLDALREYAITQKKSSSEPKKSSVQELGDTY